MSNEVDSDVKKLYSCEVTSNNLAYSNILIQRTKTIDMTFMHASTSKSCACVAPFSFPSNPLKYRPTCYVSNQGKVHYEAYP